MSIIINPYKGVGGLTGDVLINFAGMADGAPGAASGGQPTLRDTTTVEPNRAVATVSGGALVAPASGTGVTGTYSGWRLPEDVKSFYADMSFGDADDSVAMISAADVSLTAILDSSIHISITPSAWTIGYYSNGTLTNVESGSFTQVPFNSRRRLGWRIDGNDIYLRLPSGAEVGPKTYSAVATRANHCVIFEHFRAAAGAPTSKFYAVSASMFADPVAAGRTNLLAQRNNVGNASWLKNNLGTITAGQADANGGTTADLVLENGAAASSHNFYQTLTKASAAARRYTMRMKAKPNGRNWAVMLAYNGAFSANAQGYFDLVTPAIGAVAGGFDDRTYMAYPLPNGFVQVQIDFTSDANAQLAPIFGIASADNTLSHNGDVTKGLIVYDQWVFERPV